MRWSFRFRIAVSPVFNSIYIELVLFLFFSHAPVDGEK